MKKVRISKKDPSKMLKVFNMAEKSVNKRYEHRRELTGALKYASRSIQFPDHEKTFREQKHSPMESRRNHTKKYSLSPRQSIHRITIQREKTESFKQTIKNSKQLSKIRNKITSRSPYLDRRSYNQSDHKLFQGLNHLNRSLKKVDKPIRLNSLEHRASEEKPEKDFQKSQKVMQEARKLMQTGEIRKSIYILKGILKNDPENLQALFMGMMNWYNVNDYENALIHIKKIYTLQPNYHYHLFLIWARILDKQGKAEEALEKLNQCLEEFQNCDEAYYGKGSLLVKMKRMKEAEQCFIQCLRINRRSKAIDKLLFLYESNRNYEKVLSIAEEFLLKQGISDQERKKFKEMQAESLLKMKNYERIIRKYSKNNENSPSQQRESDIQEEKFFNYYLGVAYYKIGETLKAYLSLQSTLATENCFKAVKLMLLIKLQENDFYEASHLLERCSYLNLQPNCLKLESLFIEGIISLMRRNMQYGIQKLQKVCSMTESKQKQLGDEFLCYITQKIHTFLGYGYYCLGKFMECSDHYQIHLEKYPDEGYKPEGMDYNMMMVKAYLSYEQKEIKEAERYFSQAHKINETKIQPVFCMAICQSFFGNQLRELSEEKSTDYYRRCLFYLNKCAKIIEKNHNNVASNIYFHKSIIHAFLGEWKESIMSIDEAIQRAEENYWKHFYVRGLLLSSIHNFSQAINDTTIAINLKPSQPEPYFLRSSCFQIEGEGNNAFRDLQSYITLRPEDKQIHKFAGKLLFENGAFEDAITAFQHEPIEQIIENIDVFLTKSKTYFLLGEFEEAATQMMIVSKLDKSKSSTLFDAEIMSILGKIISKINHSQTNFEELIQKVQNLYRNQSENSYVKQQIFKKTELNTLSAICYFYGEQYQKCIEELSKAIKVKQKMVMKETLIEGVVRQDEKDTRIFISQMHFNISICSLMMGDEQRAIKQAHKMEVMNADAFYENYQSYLRIIERRYPPGHQIQVKKLQVFPNRNKISNFLPEVNVVNIDGILMKMCVPFPKVEPPQIFPEFDFKLLEFSIENIDRKPEAPWIRREENTINFTGRVQKYSRLEIEDSVQDNSSSQFNADNSHVSLSSISSRRIQLVPESVKRIAKKNRRTRN